MTIDAVKAILQGINEVLPIFSTFLSDFGTHVQNKLLVLFKFVKISTMKSMLHIGMVNEFLSVLSTPIFKFG